MSEQSSYRLFHMWSPIEQLDSIKIHESIQQERYKHIYGTRSSYVHIDAVELSQFDFVDFSAGFLAGCAGVAFGHPLDTIKVRQQTLGPKYASILQCLKKTSTNEGVRGFYKGLLFPLVTEGGRNCLFFGVYESAKGSSAEPVNYIQVAVAGALGGAVQAVPGSPIELIKIRLQGQTGCSTSQRCFRGPWHCFSHILREHPQSLFRGLEATIYRDITGFAVYMCSYEYLCHFFHNGGAQYCSIAQLLLTGGVAGSLSWFVNLPIDTIKSRLQNDCLSRPKYLNFSHCYKSICYEEGYHALFKGLPAVLMRAFALNAVTLTVYSLSRQHLLNIFRDNQIAT